MRRLWQSLTIAHHLSGFACRNRLPSFAQLHLAPPEALLERSGAQKGTPFSCLAECWQLGSRRDYASRTPGRLITAQSKPAASGTGLVKNETRDPESTLMSEEMLRLLLQPLPVPRQRTRVLNDRVVLCGKVAFVDPTDALHSMMRALYVVKQVLRANGQVYVVNANPLTAPLLRDAANCCMNGNVWFRTGRWPRSTLGAVTSDKLFKHSHQPNRELFAARGLRMSNVLASGGKGAAADHAKMPTLGSQDKWRLWYQGRTDGEATALLRQIVQQETSCMRLPLPGSPRGRSGALVRLIVAMSPTHDADALDDAFRHGVPTISLVNMHSPLDGITYPVYASDSHVRFQHFFMDWLLKLVNLPPETSIVKSAR